MSRGYLHVLLARSGYVRSGKATRRQPHRIKPQAHGIFALAKDNDVAHAFHALNGVTHVKIKVVADKNKLLLIHMKKYQIKQTKRRVDSISVVN